MDIDVLYIQKNAAGIASNACNNFLTVFFYCRMSGSYCNSQSNSYQQNCSSLCYIITGTLSIVKLNSPPGQPTLITLQMEGSAAALQAVKIEIVKRIQKEFGTTLLVEWTQ